MAMAFCPDCDGSVPVGPRPGLGKRVTCPHWNAELEVIELLPSELDWAYDESEAVWDDDEVWDKNDDEEVKRMRIRTETPNRRSGLGVASYSSTRVPFPCTLQEKRSAFLEGDG
jgi:hypothetical protein